MNPSPRRVPTARRLLRFHVAVWLPFALITAVLSAGAAFLGDAVSSTQRASADGIRSEFPRADSVAQSLVDPRPEPPDGVARPVWVADGDASYGRRSTPARVSVASEGETLPGALITGRAPRRAGEGTVSLRVAEALEVRVGGQVAVESEFGTVTVAITGVTVNPAREDDSAIAAVAERLPRTSPAYWLTNDTALVSRSTQDTQLSVRSVDVFAEEAASALPPFAIRAHTAATWALWLVAFASAIGVAHAVARTRRSRRALVEAGMTPRRALFTVYGAMTWACTSTAVLGTAVGMVAVRMTRDAVDGLVGQHWLSVPVSGETLLWPLGASIAGVVVVAAFGAVRATSPGRRLADATTDARIRSAGRLALGLLTLFATAMSVVYNPYASAMFIGLVVLYFAILALRRATSSRGRGVAMRTVAGWLAAGATVPALAVGTATFTAVHQAAWLEHGGQGTTADTPRLQPLGSLVAGGMTDSTASELVAAAKDLGLAARRYPVFDEGAYQVRVTSPAAARCAAEGEVTVSAIPSSCLPARTSAPINSAVVDGPSPAAADPGLVDDGKVGVLYVDARSGTVVATVLVSARPDGRWGGLTGGAQLDRTQLPASWKVPSSGGAVALVEGVADASPQAQAELRGLLQHRAPGASLSLDSGEPTGAPQQRA
ncbi:MAG: hypothetical protein ACRCYX_02190, partial [Dermatophilaceae bacterium]